MATNSLGFFGCASRNTPTASRISPSLPPAAPATCGITSIAGLHRGQVLVPLAPHHGQAQLVLGLEVGVEGPPGESGPLTDLLDRRGQHPALAEQLDGRVHQPFAGRLPARTWFARHGGVPTGSALSLSGTGHRDHPRVCIQSRIEYTTVSDAVLHSIVSEGATGCRRCCTGSDGPAIAMVSGSWPSGLPCSRASGWPWGWSAVPSSTTVSGSPAPRHRWRLTSSG